MKNGDTASHGQMPRLHDAKSALGVLLVSLLYFADIFLRSSRKPFWFDELFTVYLCRLPDLSSTLNAVKHGADFNPPLFYIFARTAKALFGEGPIASRMPEIVGVWIFCLCLFLFVSRRIGRVPGFIAGVLPFFTLVQYYAYEDRPHGITLAWCGLALLSWQRLVEGSTRFLPNIIFLLSLLGGVLTHVYAVYLFVPFGLFEGYSLLRYKRIRWGVLLSFLVSLTIAIPVYLPLVRAYKQMDPMGAFPPSRIFAALLTFTLETLGSSAYVLILLLAFAAFAVVTRPQDGTETGRIDPTILTQSEVVLAIFFLLIPVFGLTGTILSHARFFDRYFLSCVSGVAILLAYASSQLKRGHLQRAFALSVLLLMGADLASVVINSVRGRSDLLIEPSSKTEFAVPHDGSLGSNIALFNLNPNIPVLDVDGLRYIYLYYYAPSAFISHFYYASPNEKDLTLLSYRRLGETAHVAFNTTLFEPFFQNHDHFYVLNGPTGACGLCLEEFLSHGFTLLNTKTTSQGYLFEYERKVGKDAQTQPQR